MGSRGPLGLWVYAKTIIKDRDCGRLCENVFMYVCAGRQRALSLGVGFNSKWTCEDGQSKKKTKCVYVCGCMGSIDAVCKMVIVA